MIFLGAKMKKNAFLLFLLLAWSVGPSLAADFNSLFAFTKGLKNIDWNLIEKETGKIFYYESKNGDMGLSPYLEIKGNILNYTLRSGEFKVLDLTQVPQKSTEVGDVPANEVAEFGILYFWADFLFFIILAIGLLILKQSKEKNLEPEVQPFKRLDLIQLLLPYSGQLLTTETLDQLLGFDSQTTFDSRRMKRSRLIKDINQHYLAQTGRVLVTRNKMSDDKRYVTYLIQG
jgi:hypothetical protein